MPEIYRADGVFKNMVIVQKEKIYLQNIMNTKSV